MDFAFVFSLLLYIELFYINSSINLVFLVFYLVSVISLLIFLNLKWLCVFYTSFKVHTRGSSIMHVFSDCIMQKFI